MTEIPTKLRLAAELRKIAAEASPENAAKYEAFAARAETGEFDDFDLASPHDFPITQLHNELMQAGFTKFAERMRNGEFDATDAECDAWVESPEGQRAFRKLLDVTRHG